MSIFSPFVQNVTLLLSLGTIVAQFIIVLLFLSLFLKKEDIKKQKGLGALVMWVSYNVLEIGFVISLGAVLASLFYSNIVGFAPCEFCWWARILLFPQSVMYAVALFYKYRRKHDHHIVLLSTSLILSIIGALINAFQYYGTHYNPSLLDACVANGASCSKQYFLSFGYIDIPMMSFTCFALLILIIVTHRRAVKVSHA